MGQARNGLRSQTLLFCSCSIIIFRNEQVSIIRIHISLVETMPSATLHGVGVITKLYVVILGKISNGDISATDQPIHFVFDSRIGFSGSSDRMALFRVSPNSIGMWEKTMREV